MTESPVVYAPASDEALNAAFAEARRTFRYFWREMTWEQRRIVPGTDLAAIKAAFRDPGAPIEHVEHMWLGEVTYDGDVLEATLLNAPNTVRSVGKGDRVALSVDRLEDWMYAMGGRVLGAHTVQVLRARMTAKERRAHDEAWGLDFGDPSAVALVPAWPGNASRDPDVEHPMSENMAKPLAEQIAKDPQGFLRSADPSGLTLLHAMALGGSAACVRVLLDHGADPLARTRSGKTPRTLAAQLGWPRVTELLAAAEQRRGAS
jgi:uncharacterized protein YegJ (DUF2314 family)